jgi:hypothetical protein
MKKKLLGSSLMVLVGLMWSGVFLPEASATDSETDQTEITLKFQETCPIMGLAIDRKLYVDHRDKRIYVCCKGCLSQVTANPEAAINKLADLGQAPGQALCPFMNKPFDPKRYVDHNGERVYVCCGSCLRRARSNPEAAVKMLRKKGVAPEKVAE